MFLSKPRSVLATKADFNTGLLVLTQNEHIPVSGRTFSTLPPFGTLLHKTNHADAAFAGASTASAPDMRILTCNAVWQPSISSGCLWPDWGSNQSSILAYSFESILLFGLAATSQISDCDSRLQVQQTRQSPFCEVWDATGVMRQCST